MCCTAKKITKAENNWPECSSAPDFAFRVVPGFCAAVRRRRQIEKFLQFATSGGKVFARAFKLSQEIVDFALEPFCVLPGHGVLMRSLRPADLHRRRAIIRAMLASAENAAGSEKPPRADDRARQFPQLQST
jgi:hypothetical protein